MSDEDCPGKGFHLTEALAKAKAAAIEFLKKKFPGATIVPAGEYVVKNTAGGGVELTPASEEEKKKILEMLIASRRGGCGDPGCKWCRIEHGLKAIDATFEARMDAIHEVHRAAREARKMLRAQAK